MNHETLKKIWRALCKSFYLRAMVSISVSAAGVCLCAFAAKLTIDDSSHYFSTSAFLWGTLGFSLFLGGIKLLAYPLTHQKGKHTSKQVRRNKRLIRQKIAGAALLLMASVLFIIAYNSTDIYSRDCTAAVLMTVLGIWMVFTKKTIWN